jgi:hypothetical protein
MVKNIQGGSKSKGQARKFSTSCVSGRSILRLSTSPLEKYACVIKIFGQGRCKVITVDNVELQLVIRNKFKGRFVRGNMVSVGSIVLVGLREWEGPDNYKICDLLEVYDTDDYNKLKSIPSTRIGSLDRFVSEIDSSSVVGNEEFTFSEECEKETEDEKFEKPFEKSVGLSEVDDINIDEI